MKIGFYVSRKATRLKKFLEIVYESHNDLFEHIDFIVSDNLEDKELELLCKKYHINFIYLDLNNIKAKNLFASNFILEQLDKRSTDYLFLYCDTIIKGEILVRYQNKIVNFHPSLLPSHPGLWAIDQAINQHTFLMGNTAHFVDAGIDTGPVIMQSIFPAINFKNYDEVLDLQIPMIIQLIYWLKLTRVQVEDGKVLVKGANYQINTFIPNIEISY